MITFSKLGKLGRLGNQLFQVAATIGAAHRVGAQYMIPKWYYTKFFDYNFIQGHRKGHNLWLEPDFTYCPTPVRSNLDLYGYFQSEKYFEGVDFKEVFKPTKEVNDYIDNKYGELLKKDTASIHIRRTDYLTHADYHYNLGLDYYHNAIRAFDDRYTFLIFSDDIDWCIDNLGTHNCVFISGNEDIIDLFLMSKCKHNIIANSSFSWWASYLNDNPGKKVIAPTKDKWFGPKMNKCVDDLYCKNWQLI
jgi:hypothetical protein